jgi:hypothetical protein
MTFSLVYPVSPNLSSGQGSRIRVNSTNTFHIGDYVRALLTVNGTSNTEVLCAAIAPVAGTSRLCDLTWGMDDLVGEPSQIPLAGPSASSFASTFPACDINLEYLDASNTVLDTDNLLAAVSWDPISQAARLALNQLWFQAVGNTAAILSAIASASGATTPIFHSTHAGLAGSGSFSIAPGDGLLVVLTAVPVQWGHSTATPRRFIPSVGDVQYHLGTDVLDQTLLHYDRQLVPPGIKFATSYGFNLKPGVVASITSYT